MKFHVLGRFLFTSLFASFVSCRVRIPALNQFCDELEAALYGIVFCAVILVDISVHAFEELRKALGTFAANALRCKLLVHVKGSCHLLQKVIAKTLAGGIARDSEITDRLFDGILSMPA